MVVDAAAAYLRAISIKGGRHYIRLSPVAEPGAAAANVVLNDRVRHLEDAAVEYPGAESARPIPADGAVLDSDLGAVEDAAAAPGVVFGDDRIGNSERSLIVDTTAEFGAHRFDTAGRHPDRF